MPERSTASATASDDAFAERGDRRRRLMASRPGVGLAAAGIAAAMLAGAAGAQSSGPTGTAVKPGAARAAKGAASRAAAPASAADAAAYTQRFASLCAACHGANGRNEIPGTPVLAGQH